MRKARVGVRFVGEVPIERHHEALALLRTSADWLAGSPDHKVLETFRKSTLAGAIDTRDRLAATARILSDGRVAWIYDVVVREDLRSSGIGAALMRFVLEHPEVKDVENVRLTTRDAERFYRRLGFLEITEAPRHPWRSIEMIKKLARARSERADEREPVLLRPDVR